MGSMELGSVPEPAEESQILARGPSRPGRARPGPSGRRAPAGGARIMSSPPMDGQGDHDEEVDRPAVGSRPVSRTTQTHEERNPRLGCLGHRAGPSSASVAASALPEAPSGPRLEDGHPDRKAPPTASTMRPRPGLERPARAARSGRRRRSRRAPPRGPEEPGDARARRGPRRPRRRPRPGGPNRRRPSPPNRDQRPRGATSSHRPIPTWIHTVAAAAWIGWFDPDGHAAVHQVLHPIRRTAGRRAGSRPTGARAAWTTGIWSSPSKIQRHRSPMRRILRAAGSGEGLGRCRRETEATLGLQPSGTGRCGRR